MTATRDYLQLHFIVFLWGFSGILGRLVDLPAVELIFFRGILATAGLAAVIYFTQDSFIVSKTDFVRLMLIGFIVALHWVAFFGSARVSNVSVSLVGFATNSLWTAVLEPWFKGTRFNKYEVFLGCVVLLGLYIIFSFDFQYRWGLALGILSGLTAALFSILNSNMVKRVSAKTISFYEMIGVVIGIGLFFPFYKMYWAENHVLQLVPSVYDWIFMALLAGACSVYAFTVAVELMKRVSVFMIQLTLNLEPVYGIIMALIVFGDKEKMSSNFYVGTLIILGAVISYPIMRKKMITFT